MKSCNQTLTPKLNWCERAGHVRYITTRLRPLHLPDFSSDPVAVVPVGYPFDASIPLLCRGIVSPHDPRVLGAACFHDWLVHNARWQRELADAVFEITLKQDGVSPKLARAMGFAVSTFGWERPAIT